MADFLSIEEVNIMLDEIAGEIPKEFFNKLNEGVILLPKYKLHPESTDGNLLYILGEYRRSVTGRNIVIYYGSFKRVHNGISKRALRRRLRDTLLHEFTHHLESLAGEKGLEIKDAANLEKFRNSIKEK